MEKKIKPSLEEFVAFSSEKDKELLNWFILGDLGLLIGSLIIMFLFEGTVFSWPHYRILFAGNLLFFSFLLFSLRRNFKVWFLKYWAAIGLPLILIGCVYFAETKNIKLIFAAISISVGVVEFFFYDLKAFFLSNFITSVSLGLFFFYDSKSNHLFSPVEISVIYIFFFLVGTICFIFLQRTRLFLTELLQKRRELEEAKSVLEIKVQARTKELEELTKSLEEKVKGRTKELQLRIEELEKFHKLTIGRELKMVELKEEIEKLKEELEKQKVDNKF